MLHLDGDALVYIAGFAADSRNGNISHSLFNIKLMIHKALRETKQTEFKVFLTSKNPAVNFRTTLLKSYKGNRIKTCRKCGGTDLTKESYVDRILMPNGETMKRRFFHCKNCSEPVPDSKPVYYNKIRKYLLTRFKAEVCKWGEADDWLGVGLKSKDFIATHDKDIYQIGKMNFYNLKSGELLSIKDSLGKIWVKETQMNNRAGEPQFNKNGTPKLRKEIKGYGFKWFCVQMIMGDKVDNIVKPVSGDGPVFINKLWDPLITMKESWKMVEFYYNNTGNSDKLWDMAKLLWVSRKAEQICSPEVIRKMID